MAEELNRFFASVFTLEDLVHIPDAETEGVKKYMDPLRVTHGEIVRRIQKLRKNAASGPDGLSPRLLQDFASSFATPLEIIFNRSVHTGKIPSDWRIANVTPIF